MGCVASMPTASKGLFSKSNASKVCGKTCVARSFVGASAFKPPQIVLFATFPCGSTFLFYCCCRLARSPQKDYPLRQSPRHVCYLAVALRYAVLHRCAAAVLIQSVRFAQRIVWGLNFPPVFVLQASPYDTRNLADPKDVMPFLPEACGDICQVLSPWPGCGKPINETERLAATEKLQLIGKEPHPALQRYVDLISTCYQV